MNRWLGALFILLLCVDGWGCGRIPPDSVTIDPGFTVEERAQIVDTLDHWCRSVSWCPEILDEGGEATIWADTSYAGLGRDPNSAGCSIRDWDDADGDIYVNVNHPWNTTEPNGFWGVIAHEIGHWGTGHASSGVMSGRAVTEEPRCIDDAAVAAWCDEQHCLEGARGTCPIEP